MDRPIRSPRCHGPALTVFVFPPPPNETFVMTQEKFSHPAASSFDRIWRLRTRYLPLGRMPRWMGIVNVTPDSFSDGGTLAINAADSHGETFAANTADGVKMIASDSGAAKGAGLGGPTGETFRVDVDAACRRGLTLVSDGAEILDVGGESTRPGSRPVSASDQIARAVPVIERLSRLTDVPISIDTTSSETAAAALEAGAEIINDISGGTFDPEIIGVAVRFGSGVCLGHIRGIPQTMQDTPVYDDVVAETIDFLRDRRAAFLAAGLPAEKIVLDPGIGFGKTTDHNLAVLRSLPLFRKLGSPILIGHSRKRFLADLARDGHFGPIPSEEEATENDRRDFWTAAVSVRLALTGVDLLRVHNIVRNRKGV